MPRWKKGTRKFEVSVSHHKGRDSFTTNLPKPLVELLGRTSTMLFKIKKNGEIVVE